uniref:(northern house mosquito) hypothetical protein n=1 Tax=Culex pipiens TaxID=7175 RepID=A0A8D8BUG6_CULPI
MSWFHQRKEQLGANQHVHLVSLEELRVGKVDAVRKHPSGDVDVGRRDGASDSGGHQAFESSTKLAASGLELDLHFVSGQTLHIVDSRDGNVSTFPFQAKGVGHGFSYEVCLGTTVQEGSALVSLIVAIGDQNHRCKQQNCFGGRCAQGAGCRDVGSRRLGCQRDRHRRQEVMPRVVGWRFSHSDVRLLLGMRAVVVELRVVPLVTLLASLR